MDADLLIVQHLKTLPALRALLGEDAGGGRRLERGRRGVEVRTAHGAPGIWEAGKGVPVDADLERQRWGR